jgi:UDP-GlcNAc3NAcA epimerase
MKMPEEINRILTDRISDILFCPTRTAMENLHKEGFHHFNCKLVQSGDVMFDGAIFFQKLAIKPRVNIENNYILCTVHRAENTDNENRLIEIFQALEEIAKNVQIILPLHPRTKQMLNKLNLNIKNLSIIEPVGYLEMVWLINNCHIVMTDSGGLQKEAYFFKKPCITLRDETEWVELVSAGYNILSGANYSNILDAYKLSKEIKVNNNMELYGNGHAAQKIVEGLQI